MWLEPGTPSQMVWEAVVPRAQAQSAQAGATGVFENVRCVLYEKGQPTTDLRAGRVQALQKQWRIEASGGVRASSRVNGVRLQAKEVIWLARQNRLIARGDVVLTGKQFSLRAPEVELDTALQVMRVSSSSVQQKE
jgi:lipopolysaccharide assembly outer membrane protein LptD (OstA)